MAQAQQAQGSWRQFVTSDTLQAADLQGKHHVLVIERVIRAEVADMKDKNVKKGVLNVYFKGRRKPLVCKAEKCGIITKLVGSKNVQDWVGHAIEIYPTTIRAYGEVHDYIDISPKRPNAGDAKSAASAKAEPEPPPSDLLEDEMREIAELEAKESRRG